MEFRHISVLRDECIEGLKIRPDGIYVDGTLGGAGHAAEVLKRLGPDGRLIGIDQDEVAVANGQEKLGRFSNVTIVRDNFRNFAAIMEAGDPDSRRGTAGSGCFIKAAGRWGTGILLHARCSAGYADGQKKS